MDAFAVAKRAKQAEEELVDHGSKANKKYSFGTDKKGIDPEMLQKTDCIQIFSPRNKYKIAWDLFLAAIIFYSVLSIPYKIGFGVEYEMFFGSADGAADLIMDILFLWTSLQLSTPVIFIRTSIWLLIDDLSLKSI